MKRGLVLGLMVLLVSGCGLRGEVESRRSDLTWTVTVEGIPADAESTLLWIPVPQERPEQRVTDLRVLTDYPWEWTEDADFGNRLVRIRVIDPAETLRVRLAAVVERLPVRAPVPQSLSHTETALYLREEAGVSLSPGVRSRADSLRDHRDRYDHVLTRPAGDGSEGTLLFMALSRAAGVPAVFETGVAARPGGETVSEGGHLSWTWFMRDGAWVPVDIREAVLHPDRAGLAFGNLDADRIVFSRGRDLRLPGMNGPPLGFLPAAAYAEVDGAPFAGVRRRLTHTPSVPAGGE